MNINKKNATLILLTVVALAAITGGFIMMKQASGSTDANATATVYSSDFAWWGYGGTGFAQGSGGGRGGHGGRGGCFPLEVSEEYEQKVIGIAENDTDVQNLLAEGYNVTSVRPIINTVVDADGYLTTRATVAVLVLQKNTNNVACVSVDVDQGTVTQMVVLARTVIDKSTE